MWGSTQTDTVLFAELNEGDRVLFRERKEPCTVESITFYDVPKQYGSVTVTAEAEVSGPRGGDMKLELCESGRVRLRVGHKSYTPAYTVRNLRRV